MVMFLMSYHYHHENVIVMINKYFYQSFYVEPDVNDPDREAKVLDMHNTSMKFVSQYLNLGCRTGNVQAEEMTALVEECFPLLRPFLAEQRASRDSNLDAGMNSIDYDALSLHLIILTTTDWLALFRICELEEARRGRAIRSVYLQ